MYECLLPPAGKEWSRVLLLIKAETYPLEFHCRYVRHPGDDEPYTFPHMSFEPSPPGLRVGPWPGWRGIPELPVIRIEWDGGAATATVQFWGDELTRKHLRAVAWLPPGCEGVLRCVIADDRLQPEHLDLYEDAPLQLQPRKTVLRPELVGVHPRLLITPEEVGGFAGKAATTHKAAWEKLTALADGPQLPPEVTPESKALPGPERLRPEDRAAITALIALGDPSADRVEQALFAYGEFVSATRVQGYGPLGIDTQSGETLFLLVLGYDWLFHHLSPDEERDYREWLWNVASRVREFIPDDRRDLAQAHYLGCGLGLLAFAFVFWESHPESRAWAAEFRGALDTILRMMPDDGFHPHGANLWIYEYGFLLRWLEVLRICTGEDVWKSPHWRQASIFRAATLSPDGLYGITFGDPQYRVGGDSWCHYLIAARTGSPEARRTGELLVNGPHAGVDFRHVPPRRRVYEFLYNDPEVRSGGAGFAVTVFPDGGQVVARGSNSSGALFTFRAGPPLGRKRYAGGERGGYGHADPCNGSFLWFRSGSLSIAGPGPTYRRDSALHNIITFGGEGQVGDGTVWLPDFFPPEILCPTPSVRIHEESVSMGVDCAPSYLPHLGVRKCHRALWVDPNTTIAGVDTVDCDHATDIAWNLHSWGTFVADDAGRTDRWEIRTGKESLSLYLLHPAMGATATGRTEMVPAYPHDGTRDHFLRWQMHGTRVRFVWCITSHEITVEPEAVDDASTLIIRIPEVITLRYTDGQLVPGSGQC
jgi:hypothetical protein